MPRRSRAVASLVKALCRGSPVTREPSYGDRVRAQVPCVGAVVVDAAGQLLLVRRANAPGAGLWSVPGGRVEAGEDDAAAVVREVAEETGLAVAVGALVGTVARDGPGGVTYLIHDYRCTVTGGALRAGDDATEAVWAGGAALEALPTVPGLLETLEEWGVITHSTTG